MLYKILYISYIYIHVMFVQNKTTTINEFSVFLTKFLAFSHTKIRKTKIFVKNTENHVFYKFATQNFFREKL